MSASRKVPATFGVWATYEEFQKGNIPDEVFNKDEYNLAVDYAQGLSQGSRPALLAINTVYKGKRNDFARMVAGPRSKYDGAWRPYARVFVTSGVTEISDERAAANQRARNKYAGITNREMPLVTEVEQPTLFEAADISEQGKGGKYYPPVEMELTDDLMAAGDNDQPDGPKEFGDRIVPDTGDNGDMYDAQPTIAELRSIIGELRNRNLQLSMRAARMTQIPREGDADPNRTVTLEEADLMIHRAVEKSRKDIREEMRHMMANAFRQAAYELEGNF